MADVFISYAREDQDFVRKLQDALEEDNRKTWIDWKDIPLTAKWKQEGQPRLERVMNLGESGIEIRISRSAWFPRDLCFPHS